MPASLPIHVFYRTGLTGGAAGDMDGIDGNSLAEGYRCEVEEAGVVYTYTLNASSGAAESSPAIISPDTNAGNKRWILIGTIGNIARTNTGQPAFLAVPTSTQSDIAIDSPGTQIVFGTEIIDAAGNFSSNQFTAPVSGSYPLSVLINATNLDTSATYYQLMLVTTAKTFYDILDFTKMSGDLSYWSFKINQVCHMDSGDTAIVRLWQVGGTQQTDITIESYFSGFLLG